MKKRLTIVIDGPAGAGKSTVSQRLAKKLKYVYLDTGSLYRAVAYEATRKKVPPKNSHELYMLSVGCDITFKKVRGKQHVFLDNRDITKKIRTHQMSLLASRYSSLPAVRKALLVLQRKFGEQGGIVAEGRDLGTVVFPKAEVKIFLVASLHERAKRRHLEMKKRHPNVGLLEVKEKLKKRDTADSKRELAPLKKAKDAFVLDTTELTIDQVVSSIYKLARKHD